MNQPTSQRVAGLSGVPALLAELGVQPSRAFEGLSFAPADLAPDAKIPFDEALRLLANCERLTGLEHFGVRLGARFDHMSLGVIGQVMDVAPTLGAAVRDYVGVQVALSGGAAVYAHPVDDGVALGFGIYARHHAGAKQAYGFAMAVAVNIVRALTGGKAKPAEVLLCHRAPRDPAPFKATLRTPVRFDQYQSCVILARKDLRLANPRADSARYRALSAQLDAFARKGEIGLAALLRHRLKPMLMQGDASLAALAAQLDVHARTLNRRLEAQGTSFAAIRDEVRFQVAQELLALTQIPVGDVAAALSFSSHASFVRAFRRWSQMTPTQWRAKEMASGSAT